MITFNRRQFLQQMLCAAGVAAAPKFIFDMGANLWRQKESEFFTPQWLIDPDVIELHIKSAKAAPTSFTELVHERNMIALSSYLRAVQDYFEFQDRKIPHIARFTA